MPPQVLLEKLRSLLPSILNDIVFRMDAGAWIPGANASKNDRAIELIQFAKAKNKYEELVEIYKDVTGL